MECKSVEGCNERIVMNRNIIKTPLMLSLVAAFIMGGCQEAKSEPYSPGTEIPGQPSEENPGETPEEKPADYVVASVEEFKALKLKAGDVVEWKNGTYDAVQLKMSGTGTETAPIVLRAETPGKVVFTGCSYITLSGKWLRAEGFVWNGLDTSYKKSQMTCDKGSEYCTFSGCLIDGTKSKVNGDTDMKWVSLYGRHNEVSGCTFIDKRNMGCLLVVWMEDGIVPCHTVRNNRFTRPYTHYDDNGKARNGQETIRIGTSDFSMNDADCIVEGNHFYRCDGERAEIISNKSCGNVYRGNLFEESVGTLTLRHGNRCLVEDNYFVANRRDDVGGVRIIGEDHVVRGNVMLGTTGQNYQSAICLVRGEPDAALNGYWTVKNAVVEKNVLADCRYGITVNYSGRDTQENAPENSTFRENVIVSANNSGYTPVTVIDTESREMHWLNNVIYKGKCKGIDLQMTDVEPQLPDYTPAIEAIRSNAGVRY